VLCPSGAFILTIHPKHNMLKLPVTKYNFTIWSNEEILELFQNVGFEKIELTMVKEPALRYNEELFDREIVIISGEK